MPIAITLHVLAAVVWVGGMFFAYMALRPVAASLLEPPKRLQLWSRTFARFFFWVWIAIIILPATGYWMIVFAFNGFGNAGWHVHVMQAVGIAMILIFLHVFFGPFQRMSKAIDTGDFPAAGKQLALIRRLVGVNLVLGMIIIAVATGGGYWG